MRKYFHPFMLFVTLFGFINIAYEICAAMWATNAIIAFCASTLIAIHWIMLVEQYVSDRELKKYLDNR